MATPSEVKLFLINTFKNAMNKGDTCVPPILIIGDAGIGKSCIVKQVAEKLGITLRDRRLSQFPDSGDLVGIPHLSETGVMEHARPNWLPLEEEDYNILFLDEFNRALLDVRQAAFQLLTEWRINTHKISNKTFLVMAINKDDGENFVNPLDRATLSRMVHINMITDAQDWLTWAKDKGINPKIINFISNNKGYLYPALPEDSTKPFACPRTWEFVSRLLTLGIKDSSLFEESIIGCLGLETGTSFCSYLEKYTSVVYSGYQILDEYDKLDMSNYTTSMYESTNKDLKQAMLQFSKENIPLSLSQNRNLLNYLKDMPKELSFICIKDLSSKGNGKYSCAFLFLEEIGRYNETLMEWVNLLSSLGISHA